VQQDCALLLLSSWVAAVATCQGAARLRVIAAAPVHCVASMQLQSITASRNIATASRNIEKEHTTLLHTLPDDTNSCAEQRPASLPTCQSLLDTDQHDSTPGCHCTCSTCAQHKYFPDANMRQSVSCAHLEGLLQLHNTQGGCCRHVNRRL
jgi:hypothetical protein